MKVATEIEMTALHLVRALYHATDGRPQQWRMLAGFADIAEAKEAVQHAVDQGWMLVEGGHSVCLTDAGRRVAEQ